MYDTIFSINNDSIHIVITDTIFKNLYEIKDIQMDPIPIPRIRSDRDYILQINSATNPYAEYLTLRETYMETPAFFFDVSDFFFNKREHETGLLVLSCLATLGLENVELQKMLAYKLKERGLYATELFITRTIKDRLPTDPQSHRDYALALQDNGQYQEALEHLNNILYGAYSPDDADLYFGIEEVVLCEINNLISRHKEKLDLSAINQNVIADLPVDIRIVINWNKNNTDIDLWVTDPNGEKCYYKHKLSALGGWLSEDFFYGYGPEQFLLRNAAKGTYKVEAQFWGERRQMPPGPTTIMAEIYMYYSDKRQERKVITVQSGEKGKDSDGVLIYEFTFPVKKF